MKYFDVDGKELVSKQLNYIKKCAELMGLSWQAIASRPKNSDVLLDAMKDGLKCEEAIIEYKNSNRNGGMKKKISLSRKMAARILKLAQHLVNVKTLEKLSERELTRALRDAVIAELEAIKQYETVADSTDNEKVRNVLQDISDEEKVHVGELQKLLKQILPDEQGFLDEGEKEVEEEIGKSLKANEEKVKEYNTMMHVGKAKYVVNYHDGEKTHKDGSKFFDIATFSNKKNFEAFVKQLRQDGYEEK